MAQNVCLVLSRLSIGRWQVNPGLGPPSSRLALGSQLADATPGLAWANRPVPFVYEIALYCQSIAGGCGRRTATDGSSGRNEGRRVFAGPRSSIEPGLHRTGG